MTEEVIAFDIETTGKYFYHGDHMFAYATCTHDGVTEVDRFDRSAMRKLKAERRLQAMWKDNTVAKVGHNIIFDIHGAHMAGFNVPEDAPIHDTILMSRILRNLAPNHSLDYTAWELGGYPRDLDKQVKAMAPGGRHYDKVPEEIMDAYQRADVERTMLLYRTWQNAVMDNPGFKDEYLTELALVWPTIRMAERGMRLRLGECEKLVARLTDDLEQTRQEIHRLVGRPVNPIGEDMRKVLFNDLKLPVIKMTDSGLKPSMDKEVFETWSQDSSLQHPLLNQVLKYRSYAHSKPIIESYMRLADQRSIIHPSVWISKADTGRQASSDPNLQNVEKEGVLANRYPVPCRHLFGPKPGNVWFLLDYGGQEALLLVHYSGDPGMLNIVNNQGPGFIHDAAAAIAYGVDFTECKDLKRKKGLRHNAKGSMSFAIPYGAANGKVCQGLQLPPDVGMPRVRLYRSQFRKYCTLTDTLKGQVRKLGYIETAFGRRLYVPRDKMYSATNYLIQGTGAGMLKRAQVRVDKYLQSETGGAAGIVLPVHDEIILEWPRDMLDQAPRMLRDIAHLMTDFGSLFKVQFEVECKIATAHWGDTREVDIYEKAA